MRASVESPNSNDLSRDTASAFKSDHRRRHSEPLTYDTWLGTSQSTCHPPLDHQSLTSNDLRMLAMSYEDNASEDSHCVPNNHSIQDPVVRPLKDSRRSSCEKLDSTAKYVSIMKLSPRLKTFKPRNVFNRFQNHRSVRYKTAFQAPKGANIFKLWKWEIVNCVLAIGMLASIFGILKRYNGQRIPDWGTTINLSTLVALLATLLRVFLVYVVAEIIGQAKWKYFAGDGRPTERPPNEAIGRDKSFQRC